MKALPKPISFQWDKGNLDKNWHKHKVDSREAEEVFTNKPLRVYPNLQHSDTKRRLLALGQTNRLRLLTIVFTIRNKHIRIISAGDQSKKDRRVYEKTSQANSSI